MARTPDSAPHDCVEHGLHISWRARDHPENFTGRRQIPIAPLQFLEQANVLNRDDGLIGEGLEERDLLPRERAHLKPSDRDDADDGVLAHEWDDEHGAEAAALLQRFSLGIVAVGELVEDVVDVNRLTLYDGAAGRRAPRHGTDVAHGLNDAEMRHAVNHAAVHPLDDRIDGAAQPCGTLCDGIEHGLDVRRRTGDHPQDLARRRLLIERLGHLRMGRRERPVLLLQLREQPDVLDGDDGLVGEGLQQLQMCIGEPVDLPMGNGDGSNHVVLPSYRHTHQTSRATRPNVRARFWTEI